MSCSKTHKEEAKFFIMSTVLFFSIILFGWVVKSSFEANSYNRLTGKNVSTWDAMFIELRVQENIE